MKPVNFQKAFPGIGAEWSIVANYRKHPGGRIWVIWLSEVFYVTPLVIGDQLIHVAVVHKATGVSFAYTIIYAHNDPALRVDLWDALKRISESIENNAWIVGGDFHNVLNLDDRIGSPVTLLEVEPFRLCLRQCGLVDLPYTGAFYTWNNKKLGDGRVCCQIDRMVSNATWNSLLPGALCHFYPEGSFDHSPCVLSLFNEVVDSLKLEEL